MLNRRGGRQGKIHRYLLPEYDEIFATTGYVINVIIFFMQVTYT